MPISRAWRYWSRRFLRTVLQTRDSPRQIAGGVAIGAFVSCNPTVVSQMLVAAVLATAFRCSRIPAIAMAYLSNPLTAVPMYGGGYLIGAKVLHIFGVSTPTYHSAMSLFKRPTETGFWLVVREKTVELASLGWHGLLAMEIGATLLGVALAVPAYWIALRLVTGHRLIKAQRAATRAQERIERVRRQQEFERLVSGEPER